MKFTDEVKVYVSAGDGGAGFVGWRREKYVPMGGPDGGDGGNGGAVVFVADSSTNTLVDYWFQPHIIAENGQAGGVQNLSGREGEDRICIVPIGTQVYFRERLVADLNQAGARWVAARGGHGGKGNAFFKSATNQAPDYAQPGQPGDKFEFTLILKSVADVGLVGFPNVGKSSLISRVSKARPKVAAYPFTTLEPNLGVVLLSDARRFVIADIPGLIPGAAEGRGLGIKFLRHVERTAVLAQLIDIHVLSDGSGLLEAAGAEELLKDDQEIIRQVELQFDAINSELRNFSEELARLPRAIVISKGDLPASRRAFELCRERLSCLGHPVFLVSSVTGEGVSELCETLYSLVSTQKKHFLESEGLR